MLAPDASAMAGVSSDEGSQGLYVMKLDGSSRVKITEEMPSALLAGENCLYFCMPSDSSAHIKVDYSGEKSYSAFAASRPRPARAKRALIIIWTRRTDGFISLISRTAATYGEYPFRARKLRIFRPNSF